MTDGTKDDPAAGPASRVRIYLRLLVSAALLAFAVWLVDPGAVGERLVRTSLWAMAAAVAFHAAIVIVMGARWHAILVLYGAGFAARKTIGLSFAGAFFNQILPTSMGGDVARAWMARDAGLPLPDAISSVLADRVTGVLGLALMVFVATLLLGDRLSDPAVHGFMLAIFPLTVAGCAVLAIPRMPGLLGRLRARIGGDRLARDLRAILFDRRLFVWLLVLAIAGQILSGLIGYVLAVGMDAPLSLGDSLLIFPVIVLATMIPVSMAGWGLREGASALLLGFVGIDPSTAVAISLLFGAAQAIAALPGILVWTGSGGRRPRT